MLCASRLCHRILDLVDETAVIRAAPLTIPRIERDFLPALYLDGEDAMGGVRDQEIAFTVPLVTETVSAQPWARVEDMKTVLEDVSEAIVNANLSPTSRIIADPSGGASLAKGPPSASPKHVFEVSEPRTRPVPSQERTVKETVEGLT
jgi:hypothetical protein